MKELSKQACCKQRMRWKLRPAGKALKEAVSQDYKAMEKAQKIKLPFGGNFVVLGE